VRHDTGRQLTGWASARAPSSTLRERCRVRPCDGAGRRFHWAGNRMIGIGGGADAGG
jgi:hypothetical protein